jgi:hypothetical protein
LLKNRAHQAGIHTPTTTETAWWACFHDMWLDAAAVLLILQFFAVINWLVLISVIH